MNFVWGGLIKREESGISVSLQAARIFLLPEMLTLTLQQIKADDSFPLSTTTAKAERKFALPAAAAGWTLPSSFPSSA